MVINKSVPSSSDVTIDISDSESSINESYTDESYVDEQPLRCSSGTILGSIVMLANFTSQF